MATTVSSATRIALVVLVTLALQTLCVADEYDVYLLAGQSNMDGRGAVSDLDAEQQMPVDHAIIFYRNELRSSEGWKTLAPGFSIPPKYKGGFPSPTFGPEIGFARSIRTRQPDRKLALIKGSRGGTSLRADWKPGVKGDRESQGPQYRDFIETIRRATNQLHERGDQFVIRGLLWHQGESDSKSSTELYSRRLNNLIDRIREDIAVPQLPVVVGEVFDNGKRDSVRAAIQAVAAENPMVGLVTADGTSTWDPGTHFDAISQLLLGERYASAVSQLNERSHDKSESGQPRSAPPNVLFITVDDLNDWVGCLGGNPDARTPNLDRLAEESVLFRNAHCQVALCYASRASFMTGMYASTTGIYGNSSKSAADAYRRAKHLPVLFSEHGYRTMCMGKIYHNDHGKKAYWDEVGPKTLRWGPEPPEGRQFAKRFGKDAKDSLAWAALDIEKGGMPDEQIATWAKEKLSSDYDQPFFLSLGFYKPHTPMTAPKRYFDQFEQDKLTLPTVLENDLDDVPEIGRRWVLDRSKLIAEDAVQQYSPTYRRELVHAYHACVALIDDCIGQVLRKLDESPYGDNTIVVLCSDHGWHLGEKYHWRKWMPWEESTRSLLMVRVPKRLVSQGSFADNGVCERTVGLIDIYPTLTELCDLNPPEQLQGKSLQPLLKDPSSSWERPALTSTKAGNHTVRSERWRYIRYVDGSEELYDHDKDPNEWHNLAEEPSLKPIKEQHAAWIDELTAGERLD